MHFRALFLSSAFILGSFSFAQASVSSVIDACSGSSCTAAIEAEIGGLQPGEVDGFLADLAEAASSPTILPAVKSAVAASLNALSANPAYAPYSVTMASLATGINSAQTATAAIAEQPGGAAPTAGSDN